MVIAVPGLNMRSQPSVTGEIVTVIPFGEMVDMYDGPSHGEDTIGFHELYLYGSDQQNIYPVIGEWVKVRYKDYEGFVFNPYLYAAWALNRVKYPGQMNQDYFLLFPRMHCFYNFWYHPEAYWYGVYEKGGNVFLKKIKISFFQAFYNDFSGLGICADHNKGLLFIIGSKKKIEEKKLFKKHTEKRWTNNFDEFANFEIDTLERGIKLILTAGDKKQNLTPKTRNGYMYPSYLLWEGDIDGDDENDYVIHYGEKSSQTILYLSSESGENEIVKPVAVFFSGYCC